MFFMAPVLQWSTPISPMVLSFDIEQSPPLSPPSYHSYTTLDLTVCAGSRRTWTCGLAVPKDFRYRIRACSPNGCGGWVEEPDLTCVLNGGSGCPCLLLPSPPGCIP